jgi:hypothetical protein
MANPRVMPGPNNVYIPGNGPKSGGSLFVDFSRNIADFKLLQYVQPVPVQNTVGIWYKMGLDQRARITDPNGGAQRWADGDFRPEPDNDSEYFQEFTYRTTRYNWDGRVGKMTTEQAVWDELDRRQRSTAQRAMTFRTNRVISVMTDAAQYDSTHVANLATPGAIPGVVGDWASSTSARLAIKRTLNYIKELITLDTRAAVKGNELLLIMSPRTAEYISVSQEIVELVKQNLAGPKYLNVGDTTTFNKEDYGLPQTLYNTEYIIEDTVKVTTQRGLITQTGTFVMPFGTVIVCYRPNTLEGIEGGRSFSTCSMQIYRQDDMAVETDDSRWHRLTKYAVTDNFDVTMTAPVTGFLLQNVC